MEVSRTMRRKLCLAGPSLLACAAVFVLGGATGCGSERPKRTGPPRRPFAAPAQTSQTAEAAATPAGRPKAVGWKYIAEHFDRFVKEPRVSVRDPFRSYITDFVPKPELPEPEEEPQATQASATEAAEQEVAPLQRYPVAAYRVLMILSGVAVPKAVIEDPIGNIWIVKPDTPIGNRGGVIVNISEYSVFIQEPDADKYVEKTLEPEIFQLSRQGANAPSGAELLTGPPM